MHDNLLQIIEDALLAWADDDEKDTEAWQSITLDLAARLYAITGFDRDAVNGYVWVPNGLNETFRLAVARAYDAPNAPR